MATTDPPASLTTPPIVLCPFTVLVDTREQAPYTFDAMPLSGRDRGKRLVVPVEFRGLKSGDYSAVGLEHELAIERKSLADLYSTLGQGRARFEAEFLRLSELRFAAVVIEADVRDIWRPAENNPNWHSRLDPRSVEGTIVAWSIRYPRVHWWPMGSRRAAEVRVFQTIWKYWEEREEREASEAQKTRTKHHDQQL